MSDVLLAFDDAVNGTTSTYSSAFTNLALAERDQYALQAVVDPDPHAVPDNITIQLETSNDGRNWVSKNPTAEIFGAMGLVRTWVFDGYDIGQRPAGAMVRVRVQLGGAASVTAQVKIYVRQVSASPFIPPRINTCALWLRADLGVTVVSGTDKVSLWRDVTNGGFDATQATSTRQPQIAPAAQLINGMPTILFDPSTVGSEKIMTLGASLASLSQVHAFMVHRRSSTLPVTSVRAGFWRLGTSVNSSHVPFTDGNVFDDAGSNTRVSCGAYVFDMANPSCYEVRSAPSSWTNFINGIAQGSAGVNTVAGPAAPEIGGNSTVATYYDGVIAEVVLYGRILDNVERNLLVKYFNARYALGMT